MFIFDEEMGLLFDRAKPLGFDLAGLRNAGKLFIKQLDAAELSPGEFTYNVQAAVQDPAVRTVVIDSLNGYLNATPSEKYLTLHLHEILTYLGQCGATTLLLMTQHGIVGQDMSMPIDASYLADSVVSLRYFEARGEVRQSISVIKKRTGRHERTIRELRLDNGVTVGNARLGEQQLQLGRFAQIQLVVGDFGERKALCALDVSLARPTCLDAVVVHGGASVDEMEVGRADAALHPRRVHDDRIDAQHRELAALRFRRICRERAMLGLPRLHAAVQ